VICFNQPLSQLVLLAHQVFNNLSEFLAALIAVALHFPEAFLIFTEDDAKFLVAAPGLNIRNDRVLDHFRILTETQSAEGLLKLRSTWSDTEHDGSP